MSDLLTNLIEDPKGSIFVGELVDSGAPAVRHGANVGFLAMLLGLKLGFYIMKERKHVSAQASKDVTNLGVAGMLHDIGMLHLEDRVRERWIEHHDATDAQWQEHVKLGYQAVRGQINASSASAVLNHHQHFDGSGFPKKKLFDGREEGISGDNIHVFARILCTADLFDRLSNKASFEGEDPGDEPTKPAVCALKAMMEPPYVDWIDPVVFKALLSVCPAYPPGTRVKLSNGAQGVVTDWDPTDPCRPQVHEFSRFEDEEFIAVHDLKDDHSLSIVESEGVDVREMNFYPKSKQQFDLRALQKNLANALHSFEDDGRVENAEQAA